MNLRHALLAGFAVAAITLPSVAVLAQETTPPAEGTTTEAAPPAEGGESTAQVPIEQTIDPNRPPSENWLKVCDPLDDGQRACIMRQVVLANGQFLGSFLLRDDPGQESRLLAVAAEPIGVLLPYGLTWQIDSSQPVRVPFMLCDPQSCATQLVINEAYVNSLKRGNVLRLTAKNRQNEDLTVEINLSGFTSVYDGEAAMTFDEFRQESSGGAALEQSLQDRAEELRRELDAGGQTPPAEGASEQAPAETPEQ